MEGRIPKVIDVVSKDKEYITGGAYHFKVITKKEEGIDLNINYSVIPHGKTHDWHSHEQDEAMYIIQGEGKYLLENGELNYKNGDFVFMPKGIKHKNTVVSKEDVVLVAIFNPARF
jgi:quercetin dioxygenase-like cupin family protein